MASNIAENIAIILGGIGACAAAIIASWRGKNKPTDDAPATIVGGSLLGGVDIAQMGDWLAAVRSSIDRFREQQHEDSRELRQAIERQSVAIERNTDAHDGGAVSPRELATLIVRLDAIAKAKE